MELLYIVALSAVALITIFAFSKLFGNQTTKTTDEKKKESKPVKGDPPKSKMIFDSSS
jgi:hypothetical protein